MVFTGMPYSSWKRRSETEEERKERYQIQQEKREYEKQVKEKQIESDLKFAKERYGTIGVYSYPIPENDLPKTFKTSGAILRVNLTDVVRYEYTDNEFKPFYKTSKLIFSEELSQLRGLPNYLATILNIPYDVAIDVSSHLLLDEHIFTSIRNSYLELHELEVNNELLTAKYGLRDLLYRKARRLILEQIQQAEACTRFKKCWKNTRYWKKKELSKESILRLYAFVDDFYLRADWDEYSYLKLLKDDEEI
ncbi:hypothetical protein [Streptococcus gallolyticus]|uniref:Uncharacterized protein n=1 Tax=Streptococcus gallolyticus TaxID=315405 RepID=A0A139R6H7_9STRE|nr:hypothetical protein [Streptococcus gallolyticus]KXU10264.1 hypothetical protein SGADD03_00260 [Streptococcus gallolyticus]